MAIDHIGEMRDMKNDLISRQAAIDAVKKNTFRLTFAEEQNCEGHLAWSANAVYSDVIEGALLELPSAQPEIVMCADCQKYIDYRCRDEHANLNDWRHEDDYCSFGKRREVDE